MIINHNWINHLNYVKSLFPYLFIFSDSNVLLNAEGPVDVQGVFVQRQHEDDQDEESVKHREEEHRLVSKFLQIGRDFRLKKRNVKLLLGKLQKKLIYFKTENRWKSTSAMNDPVVSPSLPSIFFCITLKIRRYIKD